METYVKTGRAAEMLGVSTSTLRNWSDCGVLVPEIRSGGGHRRYSLRQLEKFIAEHDVDSGDDERLISSSEVARLLDTTVYEVNKLEKAGTLVPKERLPVSNKRLYALSDVMEYKEGVAKG